MRGNSLVRFLGGGRLAIASCYPANARGAVKRPTTFGSGDEPIGFAGLYDLWNDEVLSCTILTTIPNELMATIHDRMPVILSPEDYDRWLDPKLTDPNEVQDLLRPYPGKMHAHPVSSAVNSPRNNGPELLEAT